MLRPTRFSCSPPHEPGPDSTWRRLFAEGAVIVASILLAFAIDAWWDGRQQRAAEREALAGLTVDFEANAGRLLHARSRQPCIHGLASVPLSGDRVPSGPARDGAATRFLARSARGRVRAIVASDLRGEITAELNLARFIGTVYEPGLAAARELLTAVEARLVALGT